MKKSVGSLGISSVILLISVILVAATAASVLLGKNSGGISETDVNKMVNDAMNQVSTYIQVEDIVGKYIKIENDEPQIQQIAIFIKPFFSFDTDLSSLTIQLNNGEDIRILSYSGNAATIQAYSLFEHPLWNQTSSESFSFLITHDTDNSILHFCLCAFVPSAFSLLPCALIMPVFSPYRQGPHRFHGR